MTASDAPLPSSSPLPAELREKLERAAGGWDAELERSALAVYVAGSPEEFYDAERQVMAVLRRRADGIVGAIIEHRSTAPEFVEPAKAVAFAQAKAAGIDVKSYGRRPTRVRLLGGAEIQLRTVMLAPVTPTRPGRKRGVGRRGKNGAGVYPALAMLGITGRATPALMAEVAREVAESNSVEVARAGLHERGLDIEHKTALRLTYLLADRALARRDQQIEAVAQASPPSAGELAGQRVVASIDGGRVRIRENPIAGRRNAKTRHRRYKAPWREPKVLSIYVVNEKGERDRRLRTLLDGTMGDADRAVALLVGHLRLLGAHLAEHLTLAADGAEWIWGRGEQIRQAVGLPPERFAEVVDYYHACERLHEIAAIPKDWPDKERKAWVKRAEKHLFAGRVEGVLAAIQELRVGRRGKAIGEQTRYFDVNRERMRYATFRRQGIPMGSGAVESGVRRVVNLRMKGNSIYWLPEHAEGMLHLRAFLKAGRWDELVRATVNLPVWPV